MKYYTRRQIKYLLDVEPSLSLGDRHPVLVGPLAPTFLGSEYLGSGPVAPCAITFGFLIRIQSPSGFLWRVYTINPRPAYAVSPCSLRLPVWSGAPTHSDHEFQLERRPHWIPTVRGILP